MKRYQALAIFLILLALACGNSTGSSTQAEPEQAAPAEVAEEPTPEPQAAKVGDDLVVGPIRWKFLEVTELGQELKSDNQFIESKTTSGKFIQVKFEFENTGSEGLTYAGINLTDNKSRTFEAYQDRFFFIPDGEQCVFEQINPGLSKSCTEIFELPADAAGIKAKVGDLEMFGGEEAEIDLGM